MISGPASGQFLHASRYQRITRSTLNLGPLHLIIPTGRPNVIRLNQHPPFRTGQYSSIRAGASSARCVFSASGSFTSPREQSARSAAETRNISSPDYRENLIYDWKGYSPPANGWRYEKSRMAELDADARLIYRRQDKASPDQGIPTYAGKLGASLSVLPRPPHRIDCPR